MESSGSSLDISSMIAEGRRDSKVREALLEKYRGLLHLAAERTLRANAKLRVRCSASDVVQESLVEAFRDFEQFQGSAEAEFSAWIRRILKRNLADARRKHLGAEKRDAGMEQRLYAADGSASVAWLDFADDASSVGSRVVRAENAIRLAELIHALPEQQREAIRLRHIEGLSWAEVAEELGCSLSSAFRRVEQATRTLREQMRPESWL